MRPLKRRRERHVQIARAAGRAPRFDRNRHLANGSVARRATLLGVMSIVLLVGVASAASAASPTWTFQEPLITSEPAQLHHISCTAASACTAVGFKKPNSSSAVPVAVRWNGTAWSSQSISFPSEAQNTYLDGVSCKSSTECIATGYWLNTIGTSFTLAERWLNGTWTIMSTPNPAGAVMSYLHGVSCTSSSACTAVGSYENSSGKSVMLAERWNGTAWSIQTTPSPTGARSSYLEDVSCAAATTCVAVGSYEGTTGKGLNLGESWNGTEWTVQSIESLEGSTGDVLEGVSCFSTTACVTVGHLKAAEKIKTESADLAGGKWQSFLAMTQPNPSENNYFSDVSCTAASVCMVVGYSGSEAFAEQWGSRTIETIPGGYVYGVSCTSTTTCSASGTSGEKATAAIYH